MGEELQEMFDGIAEKRKNEIDEMKAHIEYLRGENERLKGEIRGLKFAIRCNGISGAEVTG